MLPQVLYFHTSLRLPSTVVVLELVSLSLRPDGSHHALGRGFGVLEVFTNTPDILAADGRRRWWAHSKDATAAMWRWMEAVMFKSFWERVRLWPFLQYTLIFCTDKYLIWMWQLINGFGLRLISIFQIEPSAGIPKVSPPPCAQGHCGL